MPAGGGGGGEPTSSSSSGQHGEHDAAAVGGLRYGGGDISLGRGHDVHRAQFRGEAEMKADGGADLLARHSSSPAGFFSNLMVDDGKAYSYQLVHLAFDLLVAQAS